VRQGPLPRQKSSRFRISSPAPPQPDLEARYRAGTEVGLLAQNLFPGGIEVPYEGLSVAQQIARTRELMDEGASVIYEASFAHDGIFVKVDILVRDGEAWQIHEVKMGTSVKEVNCDDVAVQYYVLTGSGLRVSRSFLVHIDNGYIRNGAIEVAGLFVSDEISEAVLARQPALPSLIDALRGHLDGGEPLIDIGEQCTSPYDCDFIPYCWRHIPEESVFDLSGSKKDKFALYYDGYVRLDEVPPERLRDKQRFEALATLGRQNHVDPQGLKAFLDGLWYPLCHLDFETFDTPVPPFNGVRPYQKIPFQFSLHVEQAPGAEPVHVEYLAPPRVDPRRELAEKLLRDIPETACVLTYNQAFEKGVLRELAAAFPDLAEALEERIAHIRDLMVPFRNRSVYRWAMKGSYSIKQVLPAMVPGLSYKGLPIADGGIWRCWRTTTCANRTIPNGSLQYAGICSPTAGSIPWRWWKSCANCAFWHHPSKPNKMRTSMETFEQAITVRWSDLDPNGHVRHSVYYDYGAQARIAYLQKQGFGIDWMAQNGFGPVLFREEAKFLRELRPADELVIDVRLSGVSEDHRKWSIRHRILRGEKLCAVIDMDGAWLDLKTRRLAQPPAEMREKFEALEHTEDFRGIPSGKRA